MARRKGSATARSGFGDSKIHGGIDERELSDQVHDHSNRLFRHLR
jgi:hypothetical protein